MTLPLAQAEVNLPLGFGLILIAAVAGGLFGLQYRIMKKYTVENSSLLSLFFATIVVPTIAVFFIIPGWVDVIAEVGFKDNFIVFLFGFGWGMGAITYAYGFNVLGMALAAAMIKGLSIAVGSGIPLYRRWNELPADAISWTVAGLGILIVGTVIAGWSGILREREQSAGVTEEETATATTVLKPTGGVFWFGMFMCLVSGFLSACANLGYDWAEPLEKAASAAAGGEDLNWRATLIRWMPMYWGGIAALIVFMGGSMIKNGTWKNYTSPGSFRDFLVSGAMGAVHFLAQIPYGIGAYYLATLGTTVGWGANIGMALIVAAGVGFITKEWKGASRKSVNTLLAGIVVLLAAIGVLAYANGLLAAA